MFGASVLALGGAATLPLLTLGPLSAQMVQHLALLNVIAPLAAVLIPWRSASHSASIALAGMIQIGILWAWHAPGAQQLLAASIAAQLAGAAVLTTAGVWFWRAVIGASVTKPWTALAALLLTGKFACLLGALLIFAPRDLYGLPGLALAFCGTGASSLDDQQLAGLLMVTACPLSYLVVGVALAARMLARLEDQASFADGAAQPD